MAKLSRAEAAKRFIRKQNPVIREPKTPSAPIIVQPESEPLLTRKYVDNRGKRSRVGSPPHYTSLTITESRNKEQSRKHIVKPDLLHKEQIRTLLLDSRRQKKVYDADEKFQEYVYYPPEKTYQVRMRKQDRYRKVRA